VALEAAESSMNDLGSCLLGLKTNEGVDREESDKDGGEMEENEGEGGEVKGVSGREKSHVQDSEVAVATTVSAATVSPNLSSKKDVLDSTSPFSTSPFISTPPHNDQAKSPRALDNIPFTLIPGHGSSSAMNAIHSQPLGKDGGISTTNHSGTLTLAVKALPPQTPQGAELGLVGSVVAQQGTKTAVSNSKKVEVEAPPSSHSRLSRAARLESLALKAAAAVAGASAISTKDGPGSPTPTTGHRQSRSDSTLQKQRERRRAITQAREESSARTRALAAAIRSAPLVVDNSSPAPTALSSSSSSPTYWLDGIINPVSLDDETQPHYLWKQNNDVGNGSLLQASSSKTLPVQAPTAVFPNSPTNTGFSQIMAELALASAASP